ncbi:MAG: hypothetical protein ABSF90_00550 [Syntrophobacteraceae bacterium]|jgi:Spy/CpxP family protein refolding chaperone
MHRPKKGFTILIGVFLITGFFTVSNAVGAGPGWGHGGFAQGPLLGLLNQLDLTDAQKTSVAGTLNSNVTALQTDELALATTRAQLIGDILQGNSITTDLTNLATAETNLAGIQVTIWTGIRTDLMGSTQLTDLSDIAANIGKHHGRFGRHHLFRLLHKLELKKAQKTEIAGIFSTNKSALKTAETNLATARTQLIQDILLGNPIGTSTTGDLAALESAASALANLQATVWTNIRADLTSQQITTLDGIATNIAKATKITAAIDEKIAILEKWIAKH